MMTALIASFGYYPQWSPDSSQILFRTHFFAGTGGADRFYLVDLDGGTPREVISQGKLEPLSAAWHPDGKRISLMTDSPGPIADFWTVPVAGGVAVKSQIAPEVEKQVRKCPQAKGPKGPYGWIRSFLGRHRERRSTLVSGFVGP